MELLSLELPYPPTINHYYMHTRRGVILGAKGRAYHSQVAYLCLAYQDTFSKDDKLKLVIDVYPPDKRKRDISNLIKCIEDSLQYAKVFNDDFQIDEINISRREVVKGGYVNIEISKINHSL